MSQNTMINIGVGVVAAALVIFSGGAASTALFAFTVASTASSLILGPDSAGGPKAPKPDKLEINMSSEDTTIPVPFGTTRVPANFIYVGYDELESTPIKQKGKGKGAESSVVGYTYEFPLSYGLCMGPIDRLLKVIGSPGMNKMTDFGPSGIGFTDGEAETFEIKYEKTTNDRTAYEGGTCKFFPGSANQGTAGTDKDNNHRHVCWVEFATYRIDGSTVPRNLLFQIRRFPKVVYDNGDNVPNFPKRAAVNDTFKEWDDANPAAVAYEVLTNRVWGKGMSHERIDIPSFRDAAEYYEKNRLGISTAMGRTSLSAFIQRLRDLFGLCIWWDGEQLRAQCIWDRSSAYLTRVTIRQTDILGTPEFNRASNAGTFNEIRLEFTNRGNNWQTEIATMMDLAHVQTVGGIRSQTVDGNEIGTRRAAEKIALQLLRSMAYPGATCRVRLRRPYAGLQPASFVRMVWDEWREGGAATTNWRVIDIEDDDQSGEGVVVTMMEDVNVTALDGEPGDWEGVDSDIDDDDALTDEDLALTDLTGDEDPGSVEPIVIFEPNIFMTAANRSIMILPTRENRYVQEVALAWNNLGEGTTNVLPSSSMLPINGKLLTAIAADWPKIARDAAFEFQIELFYATDAASFEGATGLVQSATDHFSALLKTSNAFLLVGSEIFRIGFAEETAPGVMTVRTYIRAEMATVKAAHAIDDTACFLRTLNTSTVTPADDIPATTAVEFKVTPVTVSGTTDAITATAPDTGLGVTINGDSVRPFAPELVSATKVGTTWTVKVRPRVWNGGAGFTPSFEDDMNALVTDLTGLSLRIRKHNTGGTVTVPAGTSFATPPFTMPSGISLGALTWTPDNGTATGGIITLTITFDSNPASLDIWGVREAFQSSIPLNVLQP